jgi:DNA helicase-2/ATP-dependent DNA helicase PcrA
MSTGSDEEVEEELRLTYVAMTRARDFLYVLWPLRYYQKSRKLSDNHSYAQCCRFLTPDVVKTMEEIGVGHTDDGGTSIAPAARPRKDIAARIRSMWEVKGRG